MAAVTLNQSNNWSTQGLTIMFGPGYQVRGDISHNFENLGKIDRAATNSE